MADEITKNADEVAVSLENLQRYDKKIKEIIPKERKLTQAEYDALSEDEQNNGTTYYITDGQSSGNGNENGPGATGNVTVDKDLNKTSTNPVENKIITENFDNINKSIEQIQTELDQKLSVDGTVFIASDGADYAEMFEWMDGNPDNEDRVGMFVTLDGKKIRIANKDDDYILGVVSATPSVIANAHINECRNKYLRDDFGRVLKDDDGEWQINPEYKEEENYVSYLNRPEWSAIGMLGMLCVWQDGTAVVNGYVTVNDNGIATACDKNESKAYKVIDVKTNNVATIIFR